MSTFNNIFSDNSNNWLIKDEAAISLQVEKGGYIIEHRQNTGWWATWKSFATQSSDDLGIQAKIQRVLGASNSYHGLIWNLYNKAKFINFNYLLASPNNQFVIGRYFDDQMHHSINWTNAPFKKEVGAVDEISIFILHENLELHINGLHVLTHKWKILIPGDNIGFIVGHTMKIKVLELIITTDNSVQVPKNKSLLSLPSIKRTHVDSSNLKSVGYDSTSQILEIEFNNGAIYQYYNVPQRNYIELMRADSHGAYFYAMIRNSFQNKQVGLETLQDNRNTSLEDDDDYDNDTYDYEAEGRGHLQDLYDMGLTDDDFGGRD